MTDDAIISIIQQLKTETETLGIRGISVPSEEQLRWFRHTRDRTAETGAGFLASKLTQLIDSLERGDKDAAGRLLDLLTSIRVFDRVLTLQTAETALLQTVEAAGSGDDS